MEQVLTPTVTAEAVEASTPFTVLGVTLDAQPAYWARSPWANHIPFAFWLAKSLNPAQFVELGLGRGDAYFNFCHAIRATGSNVTCVGIDTWPEGDSDSHSGEHVKKSVSLHNDREYGDISIILNLEIAGAHSAFADHSIDLLNLNYFMECDVAMSEFDAWLPKLSDRAVILVNGTTQKLKMKHFLERLKVNYPVFEFASGHGLGVVGVGCNQNPRLGQLFESSESIIQTGKVENEFGRILQIWQTTDSRPHERAILGELHSAVPKPVSEVSDSSILATVGLHDITVGTRSPKQVFQADAAPSNGANSLSTALPTLLQADKVEKLEILRGLRLATAGRQRAEARADSLEAALQNVARSHEIELQAAHEMRLQLQSNHVSNLQLLKQERSAERAATVVEEQRLISKHADEIAELQGKIVQAEDRAAKLLDMRKTHEATVASVIEQLSDSTKRLHNTTSQLLEAQAHTKELSRLPSMLRDAEHNLAQTSSALAQRQLETEEYVAEIEQLKGSLTLVTAARLELEQRTAQANVELQSMRQKILDHDKFSDTRFKEISALTKLLVEKEKEAQATNHRHAEEILVYKSAIIPISVRKNYSIRDNYRAFVNFVYRSPWLSVTPAERILRLDIDKLRLSGTFDESWYTNFYPDLKVAGMDAYRHYVKYGKAEGRAPNAENYSIECLTKLGSS